MLSNEELFEIYSIWQQATRGEMHTIHITQDVDPVQWFKECLEKSPGKDLYGVACGSPEQIKNGEVYSITAFTGNGPASLANAHFYTTCHAVIPILIEEINRLKNELALLTQGF